MELQNSRNEINRLMAILVAQVKGSSALGQSDLNKVAETVLIPLLAEVYGYRNLRNLNTVEQPDYPAIDLADDDAKVAFQITSRPDLGKVKDTLQTFTDWKLYQKYTRLIIYVLTEKQRSYSKNACERIIQDRFEFDPDRDILDYRDILKKIAGFQIDKTRTIQGILKNNLVASKTLSDFSRDSPFPTELIDTSLKNEVNLLRKSRFLVGFDEVGSVLKLAGRILNGDLYRGTNAVKSWALTWCARILSATDKLDRAEEYLEVARKLGADTRIVDALICSKKGNQSTALEALAVIGTPSSRTAAFIVAGHHDGSHGMVDWLKSAGIDASDLDHDGRFILLMHQLRLGQWEAARETTNVLTKSDLEEVPALHHMIALSYLLRTVPIELRDIVLSHVPFDAATFPLASDATAIDIRRKAKSHFIHASETVQKLNYPTIALIPDGYAIWLELIDPEHSERGRIQLVERLNDLGSALHFVPLGLQFGVNLDLEVVEQEIERHIALHGGITRESVAARLALARAQKSPVEVANYVDRHFIMLAEYLDSKALRFLQIEMLSKSGLLRRAKECLDLLLRDGLSEAEEKRLRTMINISEGKDTLNDRKALFEQTDSLADLIAIVNELETRKNWELLCKYGEILFARTRSLQDAEGLANALYNANRFDQVVELLRANADIVEQSADLKMLYCWALYFEGELLCARSRLKKLSTDLENANYRDLQVNIGIALGDWAFLSVYVANEYQAKEKRSAHDLIKAAQLALYAGSDYAKPLILAATAKDNNDAGVIASAYFLATESGWEGEPQFVSCLHRAVELSGEDGPLLKLSLKEILDMKPQWDHQGSSARQLLSRGEAPMVFAAHFLNKSLISLMLLPAMTNPTERDLRRKASIPAFSGIHQSTPLVTGGTIGLDYTALLTLSFLDLFDNLLDVFDTVYVPHSALAWLFEERQKATFHQPSRIRDARRVLDLLATDSLEKLSPNTIPDREMTAKVGHDLAMLIAETEKPTSHNIQRLVVRPSPVYKVDSLGEEEADLTGQASLISSCQAVVEKLHHKGHITEDEAQNALAYMQLQERRWPNQPEIADRAELYLDDLAVYYFLHTGMIEKLCLAEFRLFVSSSLIAEFNALTAFERNSDGVLDVIERIRSVVYKEIESGKVKVGKWRKIDGWEEQSISDLQVTGVLALAEDCDAIVADDRFFNQHPHIEHSGTQKPLFSTLHLLDALVSAGSVSPEERLKYRTSLRRAGYFFVPVSEDELTQHLNTAAVMDEQVIETAELRAIRESILSVRMSEWLQLPREGDWLDSIVKVFVNTLRNLWRPDADIPSARARSDWIFDQLDIRGWTHSFEDDVRESVARNGSIGIISLLITPLPDVPPDTLDEYWTWFEDRVLIPIREQYADLYDWIVDLKRKQILELADSGLPEEQHNDN